MFYFACSFPFLFGAIPHPLTSPFSLSDISWWRRRESTGIRRSFPRSLLPLAPSKVAPLRGKLFFPPDAPFLGRGFDPHSNKPCTERWIHSTRRCIHFQGGVQRNELASVAHTMGAERTPLGISWWRRRESNPRPERPAKATSTHVSGS